MITACGWRRIVSSDAGSIRPSNLKHPGNPEHSWRPSVFFNAIHRSSTMDKDRMRGAANKAKGAVKEAAGRVTGDAKLKAEGKIDKAKGKVQSAVGGAK